MKRTQRRRATGRPPRGLIRMLVAKREPLAPGIGKGGFRVGASVAAKSGVPVAPARGPGRGVPRPGRMVAPTAGGLTLSGWEFDRNVLIAHGRFSTQLGEKPCGINFARWTHAPQRASLSFDRLAGARERRRRRFAAVDQHRPSVDERGRLQRRRAPMPMGAPSVEASPK